MEFSSFGNNLIVEIRDDKPLIRLSTDTIRVYRSLEFYRIPCKCEECLKLNIEDRKTIEIFFVNANKYTSIPHESGKEDVYIMSNSDYWTRKYPVYDIGNKVSDELLNELYS